MGISAHAHDPSGSFTAKNSGTPDLFAAAIRKVRTLVDADCAARIVRGSKLDWVIVRSVILTDGPKTKAYRALVDPRAWTCGFISRADVADFLVKQIDDDAFLHKTPVLTS
jgi:NAD(P)H-binding